MQFGVDEAGKGPVLGSMFAAAVRADPDALPEGVADSKHLSPERRSELSRAIHERADAVAVAEIPVERIDDPDTDMNTLTVEAHAEALAGVVLEGLSGYVDAGDTNAVRFERRLTKRLDVPLELRAEHGADEQYPIVSAASIIAKVTRDAHVDRLAAEYGPIGSGYPGDEQTRLFLREYVEERGHLPPCARSSWQTCSDILGERDQSSLTEF